MPTRDYTIAYKADAKFFIFESDRVVRKLLEIETIAKRLDNLIPGLFKRAGASAVTFNTHLGNSVKNIQATHTHFHEAGNSADKFGLSLGRLSVAWMALRAANTISNAMVEGLDKARAAAEGFVQDAEKRRERVRELAFTENKGTGMAAREILALRMRTGATDEEATSYATMFASAVADPQAARNWAAVKAEPGGMDRVHRFALGQAVMGDMDPRKAGELLGLMGKGGPIASSDEAIMQMAIMNRMHVAGIGTIGEMQQATKQLRPLMQGQPVGTRSVGETAYLGAVASSVTGTPAQATTLLRQIRGVMQGTAGKNTNSLAYMANIRKQFPQFGQAGSFIENWDILQGHIRQRALALGGGEQGLSLALQETGLPGVRGLESIQRFMAADESNRAVLGDLRAQEARGAKGLAADQEAAFRKFAAENPGRFADARLAETENALGEAARPWFNAMKMARRELLRRGELGTESAEMSMAIQDAVPFRLLNLGQSAEVAKLEQEMRRQMEEIAPEITKEWEAGTAPWFDEFGVRHEGPGDFTTQGPRGEELRKMLEKNRARIKSRMFGTPDDLGGNELNMDGEPVKPANGVGLGMNVGMADMVIASRSLENAARIMSRIDPVVPDVYAPAMPYRPGSTV